MYVVWKHLTGISNLFYVYIFALCLMPQQKVFDEQGGDSSLEVLELCSVQSSAS